MVYERFPQELVIYDLDDLARGVEAQHFVGASGGGYSFNRDFGGGVVSFFRGMFNVEGDGDMDFVEQTDSMDPYGSALAIHRSERGASFAPGADLGAGPYVDVRAEHPFIAVGDAQGAFIVNNASGEDGTGPPAVQPLECVP